MRSFEGILAFFLFFGGIFALVALGNWLLRRGREREKQLELLQEALRRDDLDAPTRQALLEALRPRPHGSMHLLRGNWLFAAAWIGIFAGIAMLSTGSEDEGVAVLMVSIAVATLPFALRELDARRRAG